MRLARTLAKWTGMALLAMVILLALVFGAIQTGPGKAMLARLGSSLASTGGLTVEISGINGLVPTNMGVESVTLSDASGPFAQVDGARLSFSLLALIGGTLDIGDAGAAKVALQRRPQLPPAADTASSSGGSFALPVRIGRFAVDEIDIGAPVIGHPAQLSLSASAELLSLKKGLSATFDLKRHDAPGSITGRLAYAPQSESLDLDISAEEPEGGLLVRAAGLQGLPAVTATLKGSGPLDAWDGHLSVMAGDVAQVSGAAGIRAVEGGRRINFAVDADIARLLPGTVAPLFAGRTELAGTSLVSEALTIAIETATVRAAGFGAAVKGEVDATAQTADLAFGLTAGDAQRFSLLAPGVSWGKVTLDGTLKGALAAPSILAKVDASELKGAGYGAKALAVTAETRPDSAGNLAVTLQGEANGLSANDPKVAKALGTSARFEATAAVPHDGAPTLTGAQITLPALTTSFAGTASAQTIDGTLHLQKLDLAALAPLAGRPLSGTASLDAQINASGDFSKVDVSVTGGTEGVATGIAAVDGLFGGATTLKGALARDGAEAVRVTGLSLNAPGLSITADGTLSRAKADLAATFALADLAKLDPRVTGALEGDAAFKGSLDDLGLTARLSLPAGTAMKQKVENLVLTLTGRDLTGQPAADFTLDGRVAGKPATGSGAFATLADGVREVKALMLSIGSVAANGDLSLAADGLVTGALKVAAGDLNDLSPLALTQLAGKLDADIRLDAEDGKQRVTVKADADKLAAAGQKVGRARIDAIVVDPAGVPRLDGTVALEAVQAGGTDIPKANLVAKPQDGGTSLTLDAVANGATIATAGLLKQQDKAIAFRLDKLSLSRGGASLASSAPANFVWADGVLSIDRLALATRGGGATVSGKAGETLDLNVDLRALPLSLADLAAPGLGLSGTLSGTARVEGPAATPNGTYSLSIARVSTPDLAANGVGPLDLRADGRLSGGRVTTNASISGRHLSGFTITGSAPLGAGNLDLAMRGVLDLALANPALATSGAQMAGRATIDATVKGTAAEPRAGGTVRISGARFNDAVNGVNLANIEGLITGTERSVTLTSLTARTPNGGGLSARGQVALDPAANFPGKIDIDLTNAGLVNSDLMRLVAEGRLAVEGAFAANPRVTGRLTVRSLDVNIPDRLPGGGAVLDVRHVNGRGPAASRTATARPAAARSNAGMPLDFQISAPNNVFVRGMGLEAELGGELHVTGTSASPITQGGFEMRRGAFDILGKRLTFTRGKISFSGSTDPDLDFLAETTANDITAQILVAGPASKPDITFASTPTLPQDEIVSRLMFGRTSGSLTGAQALQVAQTIAQFSGGGAGVVDKLRRSLGVDSLDIGTNSAGTGAQVGIGRRINDNLYMGVRQGTTPSSSQVTVDMDITRNIRLQGATGADGTAEVGIGAQWDY